MEDVFARIGRAIEHLKGNSTLVGAPAEEVQRLSAELQSFEAGIGAQIREAVAKAMDEIIGRIASLEDRANDLATQQARTDTGLESVAASLEVLSAVPTDGILVLATGDSVPAGAGLDTIGADAVVEAPAGKASTATKPAA